MKQVKVSDNDKSWYLGLDIGTNSVGFCATNQRYDILTKGNHLQCGARLFEDAADASKRRLKRSMRRRLARRKVRLQLLRDLFATVIDDKFFLSMDESNLLMEDRSEKSKYSLFNDDNFTDVDYFEKFPTIYHLRYYLQNNETDDIRLVYLACHHMMKYRGHFLFNQFNSSTSKDSLATMVEDINEYLAKTCDLEESEFFNSKNIDSELGDLKKTEKITDFWDRIASLVNPQKNKKLKTVFEMIKGRNIKIKELWPDLYESLVVSGNNDTIPNLSFKDSEFDIVFNDFISSGVLTDDQISLVCACKRLYDAINLNIILNGAKTISEAQVKRYDQHKEDLSVLKSFVRKNIPNEYSKMFRWNNKSKFGNDATYVHYVQSSIVSNKKTVSHDKKCIEALKKSCNSAKTASYTEFLDYIKKNILNNKSLSDDTRDSEEFKYIESRVGEGVFCQKLRTIDNAYIPNQLVAYELEKILRKQQSNFHNLLTEETIDKILKLITFRIPYYVGPLSDKDNDFAWVKRKTPNSNTIITPWNFDVEVDKFASGEIFISRMLSKCTYLKNETVLPKQSLLYQKFMLLQDINNLKVNGNRITPELKKIIFNGICQKESSLTKKRIENYLKNDVKKLEKEDRLSMDNELDTVFNSSLSSYITCKNILGISFNQDLHPEQYAMCENIIKWHTVFSSEKEAVRQRIKKEFGHLLTNEQIEKFSRLNFSGWGRLSEKFLIGIKINYRAREYSIMDLLNEKCLNLMEILNATNFESSKERNEWGKSLFLEEIKRYNSQFEEDYYVTYDDVKELYCSPIVKRSIWQTILIVKDLVRINKVFPKKVFVEVTRAEDVKKKNKLQSSRLEQVQKLYREAKNIDKELLSQLNERVTKDQMRSDRIFLYFMQLGKCMYTGDTLDFDKVVSGSGMYDIDHIYPQSKVIDDSISNRVLVLRSANANKRDDYPLSSDIREKMKSYWDFLKNNKLLDSKKYDRLISSSSLSDVEISGFNNRQLVSTNQAVKSVCMLLDKMFNMIGGTKTEIVYSKAQHVSKFRQMYDILKCRNINDIHHAHDAYLNIVVGNVWSEIFKELPGTNENKKFENLWTKDFTEFKKSIVEENQNNGKNVDLVSLTTRCLFKSKYLKSYTKDVVWINDYIEKIKSYTIKCNEYYVNKFVITKMPHEITGAFYDETIHIKGSVSGSASGLIPLKEKLDPKKYGGYRSDTTSHLCLVEYKQKRKSLTKVVREFCKVPVRLAIRQYKDEKEYLEQVCAYNGINVNLEEIRIVYPKILIDHTLEIESCRYYVRSGNLDCITTCQWYPSPKIIKLVRAVVKNMSKLQSVKKEEEKKNIVIENISEKDTECLFEAILEQLKKKFYANYTFAKKIKDGSVSFDIFKNLELFKRIEILNEMLKNINHSSSICHADAIGGAPNDNCKWNQAKPKQKVSLVTYSPSGLFENVISLID
ncbi:MAG: type II CRISPR RNA-guided endonuclease Cas9 [Succinivibrionaceae bacterium]